MATIWPLLNAYAMASPMMNASAAITSTIAVMYVRVMISANRSFIAWLIHNLMPAAVGRIPLSSENRARTTRMTAPPAATAPRTSGR